jgi:predicted O-methyltransferase YrrM
VEVRAYQRPKLQFGPIPVEPTLHALSRGYNPGFASVRRSLSKSAKDPHGLLLQLAQYMGEPSQATVNHDAHGAELAVPRSATDDFLEMGGRKRGDAPPPEANVFRPQRFLYFLARELKPEKVLELGTAYGISGLHLIAALDANQRGHLHTVELDTTRRALAVKAFQRFFPHSTRWTSIESSFADALPQLASDLAPLDLILEDGPHIGEVTLAAFERTIDSIRPGGVYVVDDISFDREQERAWVAIRTDPRVEASVEINARYGVCFRARGDPAC